MNRLRTMFGAGFSAAPIRSVMPTLDDGTAWPAFVLAPHFDGSGAGAPGEAGGAAAGSSAADGADPLSRKIDELMALMREQGNTRQAENPAADGKARDGGRYAAALDASKATADELVELHKLRAEKAEAAEKARLQELVREALASTRGASKAGLIGDGSGAQTGSRAAQLAQKASAVQIAAFGEGYESGSAIGAINAFKGGLGLDPAIIAEGKATLEKLGMVWMGPADLSTGKATLGTTGATGGYVLPNNLVDAVVKPKTQAAIYRRLVTIVPGVMVRGVDQPYRLGAPTRMTTANWGATKTNYDESYGSYTANLVTFASIYDVAKQYLRFSAGAAERDVLDELAKAAELAENYAVIAGPGTGTVGSGDATLGVYTSLAATPTWLGYRGAKADTANSATLLGSFAKACVDITGSLAARNRQPEAIVVDATTYFTALGQGTDTAGFWVAPDGPAQGFSVDRLTGGISYFGIPVYYDTNLGTSAATKIAIAAEWSAFKLYRGMEFRIDSSDVAGDRWDKNLVGFRGEMELGFNAETPVHVGAAQLLTAVIP